MDFSTTPLLPYATAFGLALLHSLWIGALLYSSVRSVFPLLSSPRARHHLAYGALVLMGLGFGIAFYLSYDAAPLCENKASAGLLAFNGTEPLNTLAIPTELSWTEWLQVRLPDYAPWLSLAYLLGLFPAALFLIRDQERVWELQRKQLASIPASWLDALGDELDHHPATRRVRIYLSERAGEVMTLGFWSPIIVFPVALVNELTPEMARTILLHELAHLRNFDHWLNYPQQFLKTFFFYHPAAYALCRLIDREREHRCDDYVAGRCADRRTYATALVTVARSSHIPPNTLVMSATKTHFSSRIQRLFLGEDRGKDSRFAFSVLFFVLLGASHLGFTQLGADAGAVDCIGEQKVIPAAPIIAPAPVASPTTPAKPCKEGATQLISTWNYDAPQPPVSDNARSWELYERAVERYEARYFGFEIPKPAKSSANWKKPCPQRDTVPPTKSSGTTLKISGNQAISDQNLVYFVDGERQPDASALNLSPNGIATINVIKKKDVLEALGLENFEGMVQITTKAAAGDTGFSLQIDERSDQTSDNKIAYFLDNQRSDKATIHALDHSGIEKVNVIKKASALKAMGLSDYNGVVMVFTKK